MLLATITVAVYPITVVWCLTAAGVIDFDLAGMAIGGGLSLAASYVGSLAWERHAGSGDLPFSELLLWGYVHRKLSAQRLRSAVAKLGGGDAAKRDARDGAETARRVARLEALIGVIEKRDPYLHGHSRRVARYAWMIARTMGLPEEEVARIRTAAAIHDVGKIDTPREILQKTGSLTGEEYEVIKRHSLDGARMAMGLGDEGLVAMVLHHHERLDGMGYPDGLRGEEIPLGARIIAVADTFDAITSARPYRAGSSHHKAIEMIRAEAGTQLDSAAVRAFCKRYEGRRPRAMWASLSAAPELVASWVGVGAVGAITAGRALGVL